MAQDTMPIVVSRFAVDIGGKTAGFVKKFELAEIKSEIATHNLSTNPDQAKHITTMEYGDCSMDIGLAMGGEVYTWIESAFNKQHQRRNVAVTVCDFDYKSLGGWSLERCLIKEVAIPALKADNKEPAYMTIKFTPETIVPEAGDNGVVQGEENPRTRDWHLANWRLELSFGGLPAHKVTGLGQFTFTVENFKERIGESRIPSIWPGSVKYSDLDITLRVFPQDYESWKKWIQQYVIYGHSEAAQHGTAALTFLGPDNTEVLATIEFQGCGISNLKHSSFEANKAEQMTIDMKMFSENVRFKYGG